MCVCMCVCVCVCSFLWCGVLVGVFLVFLVCCFFGGESCFSGLFL